jgi:pyrimidine-nucleoside phosphorylase
MSGRGLGHTGGTIDKLESIPGLTTAFDTEAFFKIVNEHNAIIASQTANIAPADKKIYALRDVTSTVDNLSLIASSIMSKKLASGADSIVLDVKTGSGAFMKSEEDATALAIQMGEIGEGMGKQVCALISDMNQPLGYAVGNSLEVIEAVETLKGKGPEDLKELCIELGVSLLSCIGYTETRAEARELLEATLKNGDAYKSFEAIIRAQGGDINSLTSLPISALHKPVLSDEEGYVAVIDCEAIGTASLTAGAGRRVLNEAIDMGSGIRIEKKLGDPVKVGDILATVYSSDEDKLERASEKLRKAYIFSKEPISAPRLIYRCIPE